VLGYSDAPKDRMGIVVIRRGDDSTEICVSPMYEPARSKYRI